MAANEVKLALIGELFNSLETPACMTPKTEVVINNIKYYLINNNNTTSTNFINDK